MQAIETFGRVDILVSNAGAQIMAPLVSEAAIKEIACLRGAVSGCPKSRDSYQTKEQKHVRHLWMD